MELSLGQKVTRNVVVLAFGVLVWGWAAAALAIEWPQEITAPEGTITVYQPQPESLVGNVLTGRAAMSLQLKDSNDPIFGAFWFTAKIDTDRDEGTALVRSVQVTKVRWPDSKDAAEQRFTQIVEGAIPSAGFEISLERLSASLATAEREQESLQNLKNDPPQIVFSDTLAVLLLYDGAPRFENIPGTQVAYAVNTGAQVLKIGDRYYAVDNGVWFTASAATGPWVVADQIPEKEIKQIPPSSPVYNTTYVTVYDSTPDVVYVGYTPGYLWSFPYYGVPVYGTGWYYPPYWGTWYYPRPPTWGLHVGYNPWTGWNFGASWSNGFFSFGVSWGGGWGGTYRPWGCCGGWYGGGYRGPTIINTGDINIGNSVNIGNRKTIGNRIDRDTRLNANRMQNRNLYNRPQNRVRNADRATA